MLRHKIDRRPPPRLSANHDRHQDTMSLSTPANTDHFGARDSKQAIQPVYENASSLQNDPTDLENRLTGEINIDSIRALDEQIKEHEKAAIKLKRARNSLLNVSKLPPEVLGKIFCWNVTFKDDFGGLEKLRSPTKNVSGSLLAGSVKYIFWAQLRLELDGF